MATVTLDTIKDPIEQEMMKFQEVFKTSMKTNVPFLNMIINYLVRRKGKQIRPIFVFLSAKLFTNTRESTYIAATLIELLHTATLIHDDVVDDAHQRRGFFSINALWKSKIAVLLGDYLLSRGLLLAVDHKEYELLQIVSKAVKEMSEGELLQLQKTRKLNISMDDYFEIIRKKTATLISSCTACGTHSVGINGQELDNMTRFGELAGMAFQIKDDLLDYQQGNKSGKPSGNDIKEKKLTLPLIYSLEKADKPTRKKIIKWINHPGKNAKRLKDIYQFVEVQGGISFAREKMIQYQEEALEILSKYPENEAKKSLVDLVNFIIEREK